MAALYQQIGQLHCIFTPRQFSHAGLGLEYCHKTSGGSAYMQCTSEELPDSNWLAAGEAATVLVQGLGLIPPCLHPASPTSMLLALKD